MKRLLLISSAATALWAGSLFFDAQVQPAVSTELSIRSLNGGADDASTQRTFEQLRGMLPWALLATAGLLLVAAIPKRPPQP